MAPSRATIDAQKRARDLESLRRKEASERRRKTSLEAERARLQEQLRAGSIDRDFFEGRRGFINKRLADVERNLTAFDRARSRGDVTGFVREKKAIDRGVKQKKRAALRKRASEGDTEAAATLEKLSFQKTRAQRQARINKAVARGETVSQAIRESANVPAPSPVTVSGSQPGIVAASITPGQRTISGREILKPIAVSDAFAKKLGSLDPVELVRTTDNRIVIKGSTVESPRFGAGASRISKENFYSSVTPSITKDIRETNTLTPLDKGIFTRPDVVGDVARGSRKAVLGTNELIKTKVTTPLFGKETVSERFKTTPLSQIPGFENSRTREFTEGIGEGIQTEVRDKPLKQIVTLQAGGILGRTGTFLATKAPTSLLASEALGFFKAGGIAFTGVFLGSTAGQTAIAPDIRSKGRVLGTAGTEAGVFTAGFLTGLGKEPFLAQFTDPVRRPVRTGLLERLRRKPEGRADSFTVLDSGRTKPGGFAIDRSINDPFGRPGKLNSEFAVDVKPQKTLDPILTEAPKGGASKLTAKDIIDLNLNKRGSQRSIVIERPKVFERGATRSPSEFLNRDVFAEVRTPIRTAPLSGIGLIGATRLSNIQRPLSSISHLVRSSGRLSSEPRTLEFLKPAVTTSQNILIDQRIGSKTISSQRLGLAGGLVFSGLAVSQSSSFGFSPERPLTGLGIPRFPSLPSGGSFLTGGASLTSRRRERFAPSFAVLTGFAQGDKRTRNAPLLTGLEFRL